MISYPALPQDIVQRRNLSQYRRPGPPYAYVRKRVLDANRAFLSRGVRPLSELGIRQFLDIGSGIPTQGNVHEIAQQVSPDARVVYVDVDPVAIAHSEAILAGTGNAEIISADAQDPEKGLLTRRARAGPPPSPGGRSPGRPGPGPR
jgi:S-adenosyl methyltransferase